MTERIGSAVTTKVLARITGPSGVNAVLAALAQTERTCGGPPDVAQIRVQNVAMDLAERGSIVQYPTIHVYCEQIVNSMVEKFRTFSGTVQMAVEVRYSQERLEGLQEALELYSSATTAALDSNRGDWGDGAFYAGGYKVVFNAVKQGGKNFMQIAKITFDIGVSKN